jgi:hypothetical protein
MGCPIARSSRPIRAFLAPIQEIREVRPELVFRLQWSRADVDEAKASLGIF